MSLSGEPTAAMLVYATRYALGRRSGAASDVECAVAANLGLLRRDAGCRETIIRDIREAADYGADVDRECWMRTLGRLEALGRVHRAGRPSAEDIARGEELAQEHGW